MSKKSYTELGYLDNAHEYAERIRKLKMIAIILVYINGNPIYAITMRLLLEKIITSQGSTKRALR